MLVRREALVRVDGFNLDSIAGEEPDVCRRMRGFGYTILHIDAPMTMHDLDMHFLRQYWRRSIRTGYAYAQVASLYDQTSDPFWRAERPAQSNSRSFLDTWPSSESGGFDFVAFGPPVHGIRPAWRIHYSQNRLERTQENVKLNAAVCLRPAFTPREDSDPDRPVAIPVEPAATLCERADRIQINEMRYSLL